MITVSIEGSGLKFDNDNGLRVDYYDRSDDFSLSWAGNFLRVQSSGTYKEYYLNHFDTIGGVAASDTMAGIVAQLETLWATLASSSNPLPVTLRTSTYSSINPPPQGWLEWVKGQSTYNIVYGYSGSNVTSATYTAALGSQTVTVTQTFAYSGSNVSGVSVTTTIS